MGSSAECCAFHILPLLAASFFPYRNHIHAALRVFRLVEEECLSGYRHTLFHQHIWLGCRSHPKARLIEESGDQGSGKFTMGPEFNTSGEEARPSITQMGNISFLLEEM